MDPEPLSVEDLLACGECCGCGCRNCPYTPKYCKGSRTLDPQSL